MSTRNLLAPPREQKIPRVKKPTTKNCYLRPLRITHQSQNTHHALKPTNSTLRSETKSGTHNLLHLREPIAARKSQCVAKSLTEWVESLERRPVAGRGAVPRRCFFVHLTRVVLGCVLAWMGGGPSMPHGILMLCITHPYITYIHNIHVSSTDLVWTPN
jgi:hypothetical protein